MLEVPTTWKAGIGPAERAMQGKATLQLGYPSTPHTPNAALLKPRFLCYGLDQEGQLALEVSSGEVRSEKAVAKATALATPASKASPKRRKILIASDSETSDGEAPSTKNPAERRKNVACRGSRRNVAYKCHKEEEAKRDALKAEGQKRDAVEAKERRSKKDNTVQKIAARQRKGARTALEAQKTSKDAHE
ncbi:hypothetical protein KCU61_g7179, partial [Aureobasidium melanogenum]